MQVTDVRTGCTKPSWKTGARTILAHRLTHTCRALLLLPDKSLSTHHCLCTAAERRVKGAEKNELVLICFNCEDTTLQIFPEHSLFSRLLWSPFSRLWPSCFSLMSFVLKSDIPALLAFSRRARNANLQLSNGLCKVGNARLLRITSPHTGADAHNVTHKPNTGEHSPPTQIGSCCWLTPPPNRRVLLQSFTSLIEVSLQEGITDVL